MRHAMAIFDRATRAVDEKHRLDMYLLYIKKAEKYYGVARTREIHERAIKVLPDDPAKQMCLQYMSLERKLGEIDRARAILAHGESCRNAPAASHQAVLSQGANSPTHDAIRAFGKHGTNSKSHTATRKHSGRCCASNARCKPRFHK